MRVLHNFQEQNFQCHISSLGSSGLNCEYIRREYGVLINSKISFMSSRYKLILTLKISVTNFCQSQYFADLVTKTVHLGQNSFK